ncbi:BQ2448_7088 [Microbotryum intermedium]|uniref:BQ2448_7088 protein n=1 Tax=Microbotryum intermedium TaxID=269621 RepID=A0A238FMB9_9BASI|nr:BQ2448_7088 [Microbotryum intermedium]
MRSVLLLVAALASALHIAASVAVQWPSNSFNVVNRRGMEAAADCAGIESPIVCSVPARNLTAAYALYRRFEKAENVLVKITLGGHGPWIILNDTEQALAGLHNQGVTGDVNYERPRWWQGNKEAWDNWNRYKGTSCDGVRAQFVELVVKILSRSSHREEADKMIAEIEAA